MRSAGSPWLAWQAQTFWPILRKLESAFASLTRTGNVEEGCAALPSGMHQVTNGEAFRAEGSWQRTTPTLLLPDCPPSGGENGNQPEQAIFSLT